MSSGPDCQNFPNPISANLALSPFPTAGAILPLPACAPDAISSFPDLWTTDVTTCLGTASQEGCAGELLCVPGPPAELGNRLCVYRIGSFACEQADYPDRSLRYQTVNDTRACTTCSCQSPGEVCGGELTLFTGRDCTGDSSAVAVDGCVDATVSFASLEKSDWKPVCTPSGGEKTGTASFDDVVTFCCTTAP